MFFQRDFQATQFNEKWVPILANLVNEQAVSDNRSLQQQLFLLAFSEKTSIDEHGEKPIALRHSKLITATSVLHSDTRMTVS